MGTYYGYARNGQYGKIGPATPITLKIPKPTISDWSYISGNDVIGHQKIYNVAPNLLACTQPASLGNCTPDSYLNDGAHNEWVYNAKNSTYSLSLKFPGIASYAPFVSCVKNPG